VQVVPAPFVGGEFVRIKAAAIAAFQASGKTTS
jgi:hypothetical protein